MLFNSLDFFLFLAAALAVFAWLPPSTRWLWLLAASAAFYGWSHPSHLLYLAGVTLAVWVPALGMEGAASERARRVWLSCGLVAVIGTLAALKFWDFTAGEIERAAAARDMQLALPRIGLASPAGFSFYVFSAASYLVDLYARRVRPIREEGVGHVALYLAWFPKVLAGPIELATAFLPRVHAMARATPAQIVLGAQLIGWGLVKKVVIADNLAPLVDRTFNIVAFASPVDLLISVYFFAFQIYCDFSGYTDIAIGVSLLFGIELMENFRRPYFSRSTAEFWGERWHISLGHWFRDYLYIPLGGSRASAWRRYANVMLVFIASGLWHAGLGYGVGWTFLVWGALNGGYQWAGIATKPLWRWLGGKLPHVGSSGGWTALRVLLTFHLVAITWVFFRAKTMQDAWTVLRKVAGNAAELPHLLANYPFSPDHKIGFALIVALVVLEWFDERRSIYQRLAAWPAPLRWAACYAGVCLLLVLGRWQSREFIYMQF